MDQNGGNGQKKLEHDRVYYICKKIP